MFRNLTQYVCAKALVVAVRLAFVLACFLVPLLSAAAPAPRLVVAIRDYADVPRDTLDLAEAQVSKVFGRAGVTIEWRDLPGSGSSTVEFAELKPAFVVALLPNSMAARLRCSLGAFGFAVGTRAYVFTDRTRLAAAHRGNDFARALGVVMAHEIGHVLLGPNGHLPGSIMSPRLGKMEFGQGERGALLFHPTQAEQIREQVRTQEVAQAR